MRAFKYFYYLKIYYQIKKILNRKYLNKKPPNNLWVVFYKYLDFELYIFYLNYYL